MNKSNFNNNLLKSLDLINFWEPFARSHPSMRVGIRAILRDFHEKNQLIKSSKSEIETIELPVFEKPIVISYNTLNQKAALELIVGKLEGQFELISEFSDFQPNQLPESYLISQSMHYQTKLIKWFYQFKGYDKLVFVSRYYDYHKRLGQFRHYYRAFKASVQTIKCYVASNDHSGLSLVGFVAARQAGIPTIYVQHAAVSDLFPPLNTTYAFLDGEDAKEKYINAGPTDTKIELMGPMKFDPYLSRPELNNPGSLIGICLGLAHCDLNENLALCQTLANANKPFCLRFHPLMDEQTQSAFKQHDWEFSNPKIEGSLDFILRCHTIISPDSSIHLEAIILKRRTIYFTPENDALDYYGFVKNGVSLSPVHDVQEVLIRLNINQDIESQRRNAKRYHAALYTDWEGKSTERIEARIREIAGLATT